MFQFPPSALTVYTASDTLKVWQDVPFGNPRFYGCMRLAGAYRSLPRPSSRSEPSHPPGGLGASSNFAYDCPH